jgi:hypothetical protein
MLRRWDDPKNPPWDGAASWDEDVVEAGNQRKISDRPGDTDWMCGPVNGVSVYLLQSNRVNPDTEAEWKYADSSTKSNGTLNGNTPGKIWVRTAAKGADDQPGAWSDPAEDLVR